MHDTCAASDIESLRAIRDPAVDLVKWFAIFTMCIDHLRIVWPALGGLGAPGRLSFPLFCLVIAANVYRTRKGELLTRSNLRYALMIVVFSSLSQAPYLRFFGASAFGLNVLPTLGLGLVVAWGLHHRTYLAWGLAFIAVAVALKYKTMLMYGVFGVSLPAVLLVALRSDNFFVWYLSGVTALMANGSASIFIMELDAYDNLRLGVSFVAPIFGLWLLRQRIEFDVPAIGVWGYGFYPVHMMLFALIKQSAI